MMMTTRIWKRARLVQHVKNCQGNDMKLLFTCFYFILSKRIIYRRLYVYMSSSMVAASAPA